MTEATDQEMHTAVEQWARARGCQWDQHDRPGWTVVVDGSVVTIRWSAVDRLWDVSPHAALVWALVLEARPLRDGTRCKRCRGRGTWNEWAQSEWVHGSASGLAVFGQDQLTALGWSLSAIERESEARSVSSRTIPCPDCDGTGLADLTDAYAQHVLDAQPRPNATGIRFITAADTDGATLVCRVDGASETSIEALHVLADRLQGRVCSSCSRPGFDALCRACGRQTIDHPHAALGLHIAHMLVDKREGTAAAVRQLQQATARFTAPDSATSASHRSSLG